MKNIKQLVKQLVLKYIAQIIGQIQLKWIANFNYIQVKTGLKKKKKKDIMQPVTYVNISVTYIVTHNSGGLSLS